MRILSIITTVTLTVTAASAQESMADFGLNQENPAEFQAFLAIAEAMVSVQHTSEVGMTLFGHFAETGKLDDDTRLVMQNWESLAALTWMQFNQAISGAKVLIDGRIAKHCDSDIVIVPECLTAMEDRIEFVGQYVKILHGMQGFDSIQIGIGSVLN